MSNTQFIEVVEMETDEVVQRFSVAGKSERQIEKIFMGLLRNMDTENYFAREVAE